MGDRLIRATLATAADAPALAGLLEDMERHYGSAGAGDADAALGALLPILRHGGRWIGIFLARVGDDPAGFASFSIVFPTEVYGTGLLMKDLYVVAARRRQGVGLELIRVLAREARLRGCTRMDWNVDTANAAANALYDRSRAIPLEVARCRRLEGEALVALAGPL